MLKTMSAFYYGHQITSQNLTIDFKEGSELLTASIRTGAYTLSEFATAIARAMTDVGTQDYLAIIDRTTRKITISADNNFDLLCNSGSTIGVSSYPLIGFNSDSDRTGSNTYEGDVGSGFQYENQFLLQSYVPFENWQEKTGSTKNQSASGVVETVSFGRKRKMQCNLTNVTNYAIGNGPYYKEDSQAEDKLRDFLLAITDSQRIEFMPDKNLPDSYYKCSLESAPGYKDGTGFKIEELFNKKMPGFFATGVLVFGEVR